MYRTCLCRDDITALPFLRRKCPVIGNSTICLIGKKAGRGSGDGFSSFVVHSVEFGAFFSVFDAIHSLHLPNNVRRRSSVLVRTYRSSRYVNAHPGGREQSFGDVVGERHRTNLENIYGNAYQIIIDSGSLCGPIVDPIES